MSCEAIKVIVRCRPLNTRESELNCKQVIEMDCNLNQCQLFNPSGKNLPPKIFSYDAIYDTDSTTDMIYSEIGFPLVENVLEGYNGTIFAYGQTGCGKSFTMQGVKNPESQRGIIPSYLEIYNEEVRDLLCVNSKTKLDMKEHPDKGVYVAGLTMHKVSSVADCENIMETGWRNRSTGATLMNADSSRSHSIFSIHLEMISSEKDTNKELLRVSKLNLVDLAGSERQSKTGAVGDRFKEATKINLSLSALGNVISALVEAKVKYIPYRDSKLTRLLQDSLGGNTKTLMIACISPADNNYIESLSTLRYANRAKDIKNKPKINEDPKDAMLREYQQEINRLKELLSNQTGIKNELYPMNQDTEIERIEREKEALKKDYEMKLAKREQQYATEAADKVKLTDEIARLKEFYASKMGELECKSKTLTPTSDAVVVVDSNGDLSLRPHMNKTSESVGMTKQTAILTETNPNYENITHEELVKRLKQLEGGIVGGEEINNPVVKERRRMRCRIADRKRQMLRTANRKLEDDGIMEEIFDNIQDELRSKNKIIEKLRTNALSLETEIKDQSSEFECDRADYLDSMRKLERKNALLQGILDKVQPCVRKDCNYSNFDKIKKFAKYDDDSNEWILPKMVIEKSSLPPPCSFGDKGKSIQDGLKDTPCYPELDVEQIRDEAKFYAKLSNRTNQNSNYFSGNRRANQLLNDSIQLRSRKSIDCTSTTADEFDLDAFSIDRRRSSLTVPPLQYDSDLTKNSNNSSSSRFRGNKLS